MFVFQGEFVACLLALLRQLKDQEYQQLLSRFPTKDELTVKSFSKHYLSTAVVIVIAVANCTISYTGFPEFHPAVIHRLQNTYPTGYVPKRLDCHATGR